MALMKIVEKDKVSNIISKAFVDVINAYFIKDNISFNVTIITPISTSYAEIVDKTLTQISKVQPTYIKHINLYNGKVFNTSMSTVFFLEDTSILRNYTKIISTNTKNLKFLIYRENCFGLDLKQTSIIDKKVLNLELIMYSYYFCRQDKNTLLLLTWQWFTNEKYKIQCNKRKLEILNRFIINSKKWQKPLKNYKKFHFFHNCPINIFYPSLFYRRSDKSRKMRDAFEPFWEIVAKKAKFKRKHIKDFEIPYLQVLEGHLTLNDEISVTTIFWSLNVGLVITKGERYTEYEKLLLPFDVTTWIFLSMTFTFAFLIIFIVNHMSKQIQKIVFGEGVNMPSLNVVSTFFGISQVKLPKKYFSRFILLLFIIFCLIFRTAYQGIIFDFMNSDMRKPHAKTIEQVFDMNYKVFGHKTHEGEKFRESIKPEWRERIDETTIIPHKMGFEALCQILEKDESKIAIVMFEPLDMYTEYFCKRKLLKIRETVFNIPQGFGMRRNHFLYEVVDELIPRAFEAGIMKHSYDVYIHWRFLKDHFEKKEMPKVKKVKDLGYGFNIWLIACGFSIIVFFLEIFVWKFKFWKAKKKEEKLESIKNEIEEQNINNNEEEFADLQNKGTQTITVEVQSIMSESEQKSLMNKNKTLTTKEDLEAQNKSKIDKGFQVDIELVNFNVEETQKCIIGVASEQIESKKQIGNLKSKEKIEILDLENE